MTKRILAMVITLAMILSMVPAAVSAEPPVVEESPYHGSHSDTAHTEDLGDTSAWTPWGSTAAEKTSLPASGKIVLTDNVTLSAEHSITGDLTICLNGFVIRQTATNKRVMSTAKNIEAVLNICDCTAQTVSGVYHAGAITGGRATASDSGGGMVFLRRGGTMHLYEGRLTDNQATYGGGAIYMQASSTTAGSKPAPKLYIHGGEISNNKATNSKYGGAIYMNTDGELVIYDGTITGNDAAYGGAIHAGLKCVVDIRGGTISGNNATGDGGAINAASGSCDIKFSGNPQITGNTKASTTENNVRLGNSGVIDVENLSSTAQIGLTLGSTADRVFSTAVAQDYSANFSNDNTAYETYLNADNKLQMRVPVAPPPPVSTHIHCQCGKHDCTDPNHKQITYHKWDKPGELPDVGDWYLEYPNGTVNVTARKDLETAGTLNLCLNGQTINGYTGSQARAYSTKENVAVTINVCDHTATGTGEQYQAGKITGFTNTNTNSGAAGFYIRAGSNLNFYGGIISNCVTATGGTAIYAKKGVTIHFYDGLLQGNKAFYNNTWKNGGAVLVEEGTFVMHGGTILDNEAASGGAIHCLTSSVVDIRGGTITGNKATTNGGGINAAATAHDVKFSGNPQITGNTKTDGTANNVRLGNSGIIDVENLESAARIGITVGDKGSRAISTVVAQDYSGSFLSDDGDYVVYLDADSKLALKSSFVHEHCVYGEESCTDPSHEKISFDPWNKTDELPASGNYCLMDNVTVSEQKSVDGKLNLCLHGKTIKVDGQDARAYYVSSNDKLTIIDCKTTGTITGGAKGAILTNGSGTNMQFDLYGGTITDNSNTGSGGALLIQGDCVFHMYGGAVTDNTAGTNGGAVYVQNAEAHFLGGVISGNKAENGGGIYAKSQATVYVGEGMQITGNQVTENGGAIMATGEGVKVVMSGGEITGNTARNAAGVLVESKAVMEMTGGKITGNTASNNGSVYLSGSKLIMSGGEISGNKAAKKGAGVYASGEGAVLEVSGKAVIFGNVGGAKAGNVELGSSNLMKVGAMTEGAKIGVSATPLRTISEKTEDYAKYFLSDDPKFDVIYQGGALYLNASGNHKHCACVGTVASGCEHDTGLYAQWDDPNDLPDSGRYYLSVDVTVSAQKPISGQLDLCLNGHTVKVGQQGGRAFYLSDNDKLNISDCQNTGKISGGTKGALLTNLDGKNMEVNLYSGSFTGNHAKTTGGALVIQGGCTFNMYGGAITGNTATSVLVTDGTGKVVLTEKGNQDYDTSHGGGLYVGSGAVFNMYGGEITKNEAKPVEYLKADGTKSSAGGNGGGMQVAAGAVANLYGGKISENKGVLGGGFMVTGKGSQVNLLAAELSANTAENGGGGISQREAVITMTGGKVSGNIATENGAGLYISTGTTFTMTGGEVSGNTADQGGGITVLSAKAQLTGGTITGNKAENGAGVHVFTTTSDGVLKPADVLVEKDLKITANEATGNGGGMMISGKSAKLTVTGGTITGNSARNAGGVLIQSKADFLLQGGEIAQNKASNGGGGVYISTDSTFKMTGGKIHSNAAPKGDGGGIYLLRCTAELAGGSVNNNTAANGGGVRVGGAKVTFSGVSVEGNKATGKASADGSMTGGNGAGIMIGRAGYKVNGVQKYATSNVTVTNMRVAGNTSRSSGAGVLVQSEGTVFTMQGGTITGNTSETGNGGGIYLSTNTKSTITGGTISGNKSKNSGGMHVLNASVQISNVKFANNETISNGGAFAISGKDAVVNMKNVEISGNSAGGSAGVCAVQSYGTLHLANAKLHDNSAVNVGGAVYFSNPGYGSLTDVEIYGNQCGKQAGGLFVGPASEVKADNVTIRDNVASSEGGGGLFNRGKLEIKNSKILNNTAKNSNGGGMCGFNTSSILTGTSAGIFAENCIISGNQAVQGGGVYGYRGCPTYLTDCVIEDNTSEAEGSGIFVDGRMGLTNVTVTGNTSNANGYAVYVTPSLFDGHSYHTGHKRISGDMIIKDNQGGDLYLCENAVMAVTGETLGEKAYIKVTLQSGVLTQWLQGVYDYEGGNGEYVVTAGSRSITDPEPIPGADSKTDSVVSGDIWLYAGVGVFVAAVAAVVILLITKKKKAGKTATEVSKD